MANGGRHEMAGLERLIVPGSILGDSSSAHPLDERPAPRCSGFGCSGDSRVPMTVPRALPRIDIAGCQNLESIATRPSTWVHVEHDPPYSMDRVDRVARPPR
jgi:hypothetical protein